MFVLLACILSQQARVRHNGRRSSIVQRAINFFLNAVQEYAGNGDTLVLLYGGWQGFHRDPSLVRQRLLLENYAKARESQRTEGRFAYSCPMKRMCTTNYMVSLSVFARVVTVPGCKISSCSSWRIVLRDVVPCTRDAVVLLDSAFQTQNQPDMQPFHF